jgi:hypothetical protein
VGSGLTVSGSSLTVPSSVLTWASCPDFSFFDGQKRIDSRKEATTPPLLGPPSREP